MLVSNTDFSFFLQKKIKKIAIKIIAIPLMAIPIIAPVLNSMLSDSSSDDLGKSESFIL